MDEETKMFEGIPKNYDGFYFHPEERDGKECFAMSFFRFTLEADQGAKVDFTRTGDCFHVAFFEHDEKVPGGIRYDAAFEGIFVDPVTYVRTMKNPNLYGCFVRKTTKSPHWFNNYLEQTILNIVRMKTEALFSLGYKVVRYFK